MRAYTAIMKEKARQNEYFRAIQIEKKLQQHHEILKRIEQKIKFKIK
jgi:hypothetical protein